MAEARRAGFTDSPILHTKRADCFVAPGLAPLFDKGLVDCHACANFVYLASRFASIGLAQASHPAVIYSQRPRPRVGRGLPLRQHRDCYIGSRISAVVSQRAGISRGDGFTSIRAERWRGRWRDHLSTYGRQSICRVSMLRHFCLAALPCSSLLFGLRRVRTCAPRLCRTTRTWS